MEWNPENIAEGRKQWKRYLRTKKKWEDLIAPKPFNRYNCGWHPDRVVPYLPQIWDTVKNDVKGALARNKGESFWLSYYPVHHIDIVGAHWPEHNFNLIAEDILTLTLKSTRTAAGAIKHWTTPRLQQYHKQLGERVAKASEPCLELGEELSQERYEMFKEYIHQGVSRSKRSIYRAGKDWDRNRFREAKEKFVPAVLSHPESCYQLYSFFKYNSEENNLLLRGAMKKKTVREKLLSYLNKERMYSVVIDDWESKHAQKLFRDKENPVELRYALVETFFDNPQVSRLSAADVKNILHVYEKIKHHFSEPKRLLSYAILYPGMASLSDKDFTCLSKMRDLIVNKGRIYHNGFDITPVHTSMYEQKLFEECGNTLKQEKDGKWMHHCYARLCEMTGEERSFFALLGLYAGFEQSSSITNSDILKLHDVLDVAEKHGQRKSFFEGLRGAAKQGSVREWSQYILSHFKNQGIGGHNYRMMGVA